MCQVFCVYPWFEHPRIDLAVTGRKNRVRAVMGIGQNNIKNILILLQKIRKAELAIVAKHTKLPPVMPTFP